MAKEKYKYFKVKLEEGIFFELLSKVTKAIIFSYEEYFYIKTVEEFSYEKINEIEFNEIYIDKKNKEEKHLINHFFKNNKYYRIMRFKNINNQLDLFSLFKKYKTFIEIEKKENLLENLEKDLEIEKKKYTSENLPIDLINIEDKFKSLKKENFEKLFNFEIKIILKGDSLEDLSEKSEEFISLMFSKGIYSFTETHSHSLFNFSNKKNGLGLGLKGQNKLELFSSIQVEENSKIKSTQNLIPFEKILKNGLVRINQNEYCEIYKFENINYLFAREKEKEDLFLGYRELISTFSKDVNIQILINNDILDIKRKKSEMLCKIEKNDPNKDYIEYYNEFLEENIKIAEANAPERTLYLVLKVKEKNDLIAKEVINRVVLPMRGLFKSLGSLLTELTIEEKIVLYYSYYNFDYTENSKNRKITIPNDITLKNFLAPSSIKLKPKFVHQGLSFKRSFKISRFPSYLRDTFISDIVSLPFETSLSIHIDIDDFTKNMDLITSQILKMERNILEKQEARKKGKSGYISHNLQSSYQEANKLRDILQKDDEKLYEVSIYVTIQAKSKKDLELRTDTLESTIKKHMFNFNKLLLEQVEGINCNLPLGVDFIGQKRTVITRNLACLSPFSSQELYDEKGIFYGRSKSEKLLVADRKKLMNSSGWFLGVPGSGKSFLAKKEMLSVNFRYKNDDILVIDPENEYAGMLKKLGGEIIDISVKTKTFLNPLHITDDLTRLLDTSSDENPVLVKKEAIMGFIESLLNRGLENSEKTLIDRISIKLYERYIESLMFIKEHEDSIKKLELIKNNMYENEEKSIEINVRIDEHKKKIEEKGIVKSPNLRDLYNELLEVKTSVDAQEMALELEYHVNGTVNIFSHDSNVNTDNRIVCYNIRDVKKELKGSSLILICDHMWERVCKNQALKKNTWIYIDEIYLLFEHEKSADFLMEFYKRTRKYGGIPTGITQNVGDLLKNHKAKTMLSNAEFKCVLNQSPNDREELAALFELSEIQVDQIKNSASGEGLLIASKNVIPFADKFPIENPLYEMMNTRLIAEETENVLKVNSAGTIELKELNKELGISEDVI